jgi:hypothetical protein
MSWQRRLQELAAAGGALTSLAACQGGVPCGNANPDPCVCDRMPSDSPQCEAEKACRADGDSWVFAGQSEPGLQGRCEHYFDAGVDVPHPCNVLDQTGCMAGQKCTWIIDAITPGPLGHIGCVPDGAVDIGSACTQGAPGPMGFDNCKAGEMCWSGICEQVCDPQGGAPQCGASTTCTVHTELFGQPPAAGTCDPT